MVEYAAAVLYVTPVDCCIKTRALSFVVFDDVLLPTERNEHLVFVPPRKGKQNLRKLEI